MAKDFVVNITGKDNLSNTLKGIKQELKDTAGSTAAIDNIRRKFEQISKSTQPLKTQLRQLNNLMGQMKSTGLASSYKEDFDKITEAAGRTKQQMNQVNAAITRAASKTPILDQMGTAFNGISAAANIATGAMNLFGSENDDVQKAILQVQSVVAAGMGFSQLIPVLKAAKIAQLGFNRVLMNNPYAVAATAVIALGTAIYKLASNHNEAIKAEQEHQKALQDLADANQRAADMYGSEYAKAVTNLVPKFQVLAAQYQSLKTNMEKTEFIKNNQSAFNELGISIDDTRDAENVFVKNTNAMVQALILRARAIAMQNVAIKLYEDSIKKKIAADNADAEATKNMHKDAQKRINNRNQHAVAGFLGHKKGETFNKARQRQLNEANNKDKQILGKQYKSTSDRNIALREGAKNDIKIADNLGKQSIKTSNQSDQMMMRAGGKKAGRGTRRTNTGKHTSSNVANTSVTGANNEYKANAETIKDMENNVSLLEDKLKGLKPNTEEFKKVSDEIDGWKDKITDADFVLIPKTINDANNNVSILQDKLNRLDVNSDQFKEVSEQLEEAKKKAAEFQEKLNKPTFEDGSVNYLKDMISKIQEQLDNANLTADVRLNLIQDKNDLEDEVANMEDPNKAKREADEKAEKEAEERNERDKKRQEETINSYKAMGDAASAMGNIMSNAGLQGASAAMQVASATMNAAAQIIPQVMKIIAAKQAEAMAGGTASAAALPFPANIAAIASIIATVLSTFNTIFSAVGAYASGGIIQGASTHGDQLFARVNAGEMILNGSQQARLFDILDGASNNNSIGQVEFKISGSTLKGVLRNYDNKMSVL